MAPPSLIDPIPTDTVAAADFAWPDFDRWQAAFTAAGLFPPRWHGLEYPPPAATREAEAYRRHKLELFQEWLDMLAQRSVALAHYARRGLRTRIVRQDERAPCPVCDPFTRRDVGPALDGMPPFHPGCRCVLVAAHPVWPGRRTRSYERRPDVGERRRR